LGRVLIPETQVIAAILVTSFIAGLFVLLGDLKLVAIVTDFAVYLVFLAVNATVIVLRLKQPATDRPFSVPIRFGPVPVIPVIALGAVVVMATQLDFTAAGLGVLLVGVGLIVHLVLKASQTDS
jgi:APA family basic amino acid/polyamine antiporter